MAVPLMAQWSSRADGLGRWLALVAAGTAVTSTATRTALCMAPVWSSVAWRWRQAAAAGCGLRTADCDRSVAWAGGGGRGRPRVRPTAAPEAARGGLSMARGGTAASHEVTRRRRHPDRVFLDCDLVLPGCVRACQGWEAPGETLCRHYYLWPRRRRPRASFSRRGCHVGAPFLVHGGSLGENPIQFLDGRWRRLWRRALLGGIVS